TFAVVQPRRCIASRRALPTRTIPLPSTSKGKVWPQRRRDAISFPICASPCRRTFAGSGDKLLISTVSTFILVPLVQPLGRVGAVLSRVAGFGWAYPPPPRKPDGDKAKGSGRFPSEGAPAFSPPYPLG